MAGWSPPSLPRELLVGLAVVYALLFLYVVFVQGSLLVVALPSAVFVVAYVVWRFLVALEAVADGVYRIADQHEDE